MGKAYKPSPQVAESLGPIVSLLTHPKTQVINDEFIGKTFLCVFPTGELYYDSGLALDTDGSKYAFDDPTGARGPGHISPTSITDAAGKNLDADKVSYFVLPKDGFDRKHKIADGDFGIVLYGPKKAYACYGDRGPANKLGEGSIALHRALGFERTPGGRLMNVGMDSGVVTIVFPHSGNGFGRTSGESAAQGPPLFQKLRETAFAYEMELLRRYKTRDLPLKVLRNEDALQAALSDWMQEVVDHTPPAPGADGDGEDLVRTAEGIEILQYAPAGMALAGVKTDDSKQTVYAEFKLGWTPAQRWYVSKVVFHLGPREQAEAERAKIRANY